MNNPPYAASTFGHGGGATATTLAPGSAQAWTVGQKQQNRCNDPIFGGLFYINIIAIVAVVIAFYDPETIEFNNNKANNNNKAGSSLVITDASGLISVAVSTAAFAAVLSGVVLQIMLCIPGALIKSAIFFNIGIAALAFVLGIVTKNIFASIIGGIYLAIMLCYARLVWSRIPFATANLKTACAAVRANCGLSIIAYVFTAFAFAWTILWAVAMASLQDEIANCQDVEGEEEQNCENPNYGYLFLLFLSYFFTHEVLRNCVHCIVAGTVGSWWIEPSTSGFCSSAVCGAMFRTLTYSFGSICMGSLLVALVQAIRQLAETARQNEEYGAVIACCVDCILGCLEAIIEYFNKWAFVYVGLYGYGYCQAGKSVIQLFKDRGWEAIIADDLTGMVLGMMSLVVGLITGCLGLVLRERTDWFEAYGDENKQITVVAFILGLIIGLVLCSILMSVVGSAVNTVIVLFAEKPGEFETNYQELSRQMRAAYIRAYPGSV